MPASLDDVVKAVEKSIADQTADLTRSTAPVSATVSSVASLDASRLLVAPNINRKGLMIYNSDANALSIIYGPVAAASAGNRSVLIPAGGLWEMPLPIYLGVIAGIWAADGSGSAEITEW